LSKKQEGTGIPPQHAKTARAGDPGTGIDRKLHDPVQDKLSPVFPLDLSKARGISDLMRGMADTAFTGRQLGEAVDVLEAMARDKD
jgi:hypothetical protein